MIAFFAHFLYVLAGWTLVIKFAFPVAMALAEGVPTGTYVYWDFWWVVHIWLGWSMLHWQRYTWWLAVGVALVEIVIVVVKLWLFLADPEWTIWQTNWFINSSSCSRASWECSRCSRVRSAALRRREPASPSATRR